MVKPRADTDITKVGSLQYMGENNNVENRSFLVRKEIYEYIANLIPQNQVGTVLLIGEPGGTWTKTHDHHYMKQNIWR